MNKEKLDQIKQEFEEKFRDNSPIGHNPFRFNVDNVWGFIEKTIKEVERETRKKDFSLMEWKLYGVTEHGDRVTVTFPSTILEQFLSQQETGGAEDQEEFRARNRPAGAEQQPSNKLSKESEK